jgi:hypothetical protein
MTLQHKVASTLRIIGRARRADLVPDRNRDRRHHRPSRDRLVYNYPTRTHVDISAETIERLVRAHPNTVGLKQSDGNLRLVTQVRRRLGPSSAASNSSRCPD